METLKGLYSRSAFSQDLEVDPFDDNYCIYIKISKNNFYRRFIFKITHVLLQLCRKINY